MVMGNFMQFSQVNDLSLYFSIMQPMFSFTKQTKKTMMGKTFGTTLCVQITLC